MERRYGLIFTVIFFLIIFSGCTIKEAAKDKTEQEKLKERVLTYWDHKIKEEFDKSYEFEDPLFRKKINMVNYIKSFNTVRAKWTGARLENIKIEDDTALIDMKIKVHLPVTSSKSLDQEVPLKEKWVKVDASWYHIPQKKGARTE